MKITLVSQVLHGDMHPVQTGFAGTEASSKN